MRLNNKTVNVHSIEFDGINPNDAPDFCDAYVSYAEYKDFTRLSERDIDQLMDDFRAEINFLMHERG